MTKNFTGYALISLSTGEEDSVLDRAAIERGGLRTVIVAITDRHQVA